MCWLCLLFWVINFLFFGFFKLFIIVLWFLVCLLFIFLVFYFVNFFCFLVFWLSLILFFFRLEFFVVFVWEDDFFFFGEWFVWIFWCFFLFFFWWCFLECLFLFLWGVKEFFLYLLYVNLLKKEFWFFIFFLYFFVFLVFFDR